MRWSTKCLERINCGNLSILLLRTEEVLSDIVDGAFLHLATAPIPKFTERVGADTLSVFVIEEASFALDQVIFHNKTVSLAQQGNVTHAGDASQA